MEAKLPGEQSIIIRISRVGEILQVEFPGQFVINNEIIENHILEDRIESAKKFEIDSTPTLIINNKKFDKPLTYKNLKKAIEKLI